MCCGVVKVVPVRWVSLNVYWLRLTKLNRVKEMAHVMCVCISIQANQTQWSLYMFFLFTRKLNSICDWIYRITHQFYVPSHRNVRFASNRVCTGSRHYFLFDIPFKSMGFSIVFVFMSIFFVRLFSFFLSCAHFNQSLDIGALYALVMFIRLEIHC